MSTAEPVPSLNRILIVDDDQLVGRAILRLMRKRDAVHVLSGSAALEALETFDAQVILSDVNMPQMTGPQLFNRLLEQGTKLPFAFITGGNLDDETQDLVRKHEIELIQKPFDRAQINEALARLASRWLEKSEL